MEVLLPTESRSEPRRYDSEYELIMFLRYISVYIII